MRASLIVVAALLLACAPMAVFADNPVDAGPVANSTVLDNITVTVYHATADQTDSNPFETADGTRFTRQDIAVARICALSREFLARWGGPIEYGDALWVDIEGPLGGLWYVHDTLGKDADGNDFRGFVDLLVPRTVVGRWGDVAVWLAWRHSWHSKDGT